MLHQYKRKPATRKHNVGQQQSSCHRLVKRTAPSVAIGGRVHPLISACTGRSARLCKQQKTKKQKPGNPQSTTTCTPSDPPTRFVAPPMQLKWLLHLPIQRTVAPSSTHFPPRPAAHAGSRTSHRPVDGTRDVEWSNRCQLRPSPRCLQGVVGLRATGSPRWALVVLRHSR